MSVLNKTSTILAQIKHAKPLILNLSNYVTADFVANGLLSLGASPIMSYVKHEIEDLLIMAHAVVINLGTLNDEFINLCEFTCRIANQLDKPIILDPVGAGASIYRTEASRRLINDFEIAIVRGNIHEVAALCGLATEFNDEELIENVQLVSRSCHVVFAMSGEIDIVLDGNKTIECERGSPLMASVTGTGCLLSGVVGAFHALHPDRFEAASAAMFFYAVAGELAEKSAAGPGSFKSQLLDTLYHLQSKEQYEFAASRF